MPSDNHNSTSAATLAALKAELAEARAQIEITIAMINKQEALIAAKDALIRSFVLDMIDYMTKNDLGDPEQMHNIKWARKLGCHDTLETSDDPG